MARPEVEPKTPLGRRLRDIRKALGDQDRADFAARLGLNKSTLANYERGEAEPPASALSAYARLGVSLEWLVSGEGEMFANPPKAPLLEARRIEPALFRQVGRLVARIHKEEGVRLPPDAALDEQAEAYNALMARAEDPSDAAELESLLPWLESRLRKKLQAAAAEPGTGKRQA
ncbi:helix-turn-helix domain-containing protein [Stappia indica]|uniref:helix-turn-helix domain-containing protein n=1 Tax=Stappia indica TaxID=538381 RepID=UPI000BE316F5|nr:helix-turn-helix transcriptional regulator [Stappia indica]